MRKIPTEKILFYSGAVAATIVLTLILQKIKRWNKPPIWVHPIYFAVVAACLLLIPEDLQDDIFSPGGVVVVGTILPVYSSIVAVCSIGSGDDVMWLQFWASWGSLSFATEFMDDITSSLPNAGEHWFEFEFFTVLWLVLPFTNGAAVLYNNITRPFLVPLASKMVAQFQGWMQSILTIVNTSHLWFVWYTFMTFGEDQRRFITVAIGTAYPMIASIAAIAHKDTLEDKGKDELESSQSVTQWLTYWSCYMVLFVAMDYLENFVGSIRGFYSVCAVATLYLGLPMFNGADVVFRRILVPLSGQYEEMLVRDAWIVRQGIAKTIPDKHRGKVMTRAASLFLAKDEKKQKKF